MANATSAASKNLLEKFYSKTPKSLVHFNVGAGGEEGGFWGWKKLGALIGLREWGGGGGQLVEIKQVSMKCSHAFTSN